MRNLTTFNMGIYTLDPMKAEPDTSPLDKLPPILKKNLHKNLCVCNEVVKMDIINAIVNGATTVAEVKKETYASLGTGCCVRQIERLIECLCSSDDNDQTRHHLEQQSPD